MSKTGQQHAYQRGARIARLWKKVKGSVLHWDKRCVAWANKKHLPSWIGHAPIIVALLGLLTAILMGSVVIAGCLLFICAITFTIQQIGQANHQGHDVAHLDSSTSNEPLTEFRNGDQGYGLYCGSYRIDQDED
ncbi:MULTISPECIES: DUF3742 family protein [Enterobacteriaceae]|uniref:DUF3742 family protein n=1 Tax=Enterobacteriaceae TaxID=543 RepID=UPI0008632791|nr:DUF3742 family protein [Klebsiella sp. LTGPAF-6F]AOV10022.1 hypothetical protein BJF97_02825 [Klebsiella sp. LTGPAF-6F]